MVSWAHNPRDWTCPSGHESLCWSYDLDVVWSLRLRRLRSQRSCRVAQTVVGGQQACLRYWTSLRIGARLHGRPKEDWMSLRAGAWLHG